MCEEHPLSLWTFVETVFPFRIFADWDLQVKITFVGDYWCGSLSRMDYCSGDFHYMFLG